VHEPAHRGRPAVACVAVEDDRKGNGARDVPRELQTFGGGEEAGVGERGVVTAGDAGAGERRFAARGFHDRRVKRVGRAEHRQNSVVASQQRPELRRGPGRPSVRHDRWSKQRRPALA
jgi:hypothetical protein